MTKTRYFGTDGIRGRVGKSPLVPEFVLKLGYAAGKVLGNAAKTHPTFVVGRDTRQSGQMLQSALTAGMLSSGATVIDLGVITTPGVAFLARKLNVDAGVVLSASHNPVDENGIKFFNPKGMKLSESVELAIESLIDTEMDLGNMSAADFGRSIDGTDMRELYVDDLVDEHNSPILSGLKLVLDCANGAASWYAPEVFSRLGAAVVTINASPTGMNINDMAGSEHVRSYPANIAALIRQYDANFGITFDGDADRVIFVDENGNLVDGDHMLAILANYLQAQGLLTANTVVSTNMANGSLNHYFTKRGIQFIETPVGDKYVMEKLVGLQDHTAQPHSFGLGGEQSGHIIIMDKTHRTGDGIRSALFLIKAFLESGSETLSSLANSINKYPQLIASCYVESKPDISQIQAINDLKTKMQENLPGLVRMNLRYSGTEPKFRLMLEADTRHQMAELAAYAWQVCETIQRETQTPAGAPIEVLNVTSGGLLSKALKYQEEKMHTSKLELTALAPAFNQVNRLLFTAENPESWAPAVSAALAFLDELDRLVISQVEVIAQNPVDSSRALSMLLTLVATGTQYRLEQFKAKDEGTKALRQLIDQHYIPETGTMRQKAIQLAKRYLTSPVFDSLADAIKFEILPLLDTMNYELDPDRFMPFRVIQIANIYERLYSFRLRTHEPLLIGDTNQIGLLREIYDRKYLRFGTSGVRGRWQNDFTERRARQVVQAICDYLNDKDVPDFVGRENLAGKRIVLGNDTRRNSDLVMNWVAETCLANGFTVDINNRDTPTPVLAFYETEVLPPGEVAGLIICTASHNPPEWQGIKFNPRLGYPAPTNVTDFIAFRINELQLLDAQGGVADVEESRLRGKVRGFDPLNDYIDWIKENGKGNGRIPIDFDRIRTFFADKHVVVDEMHGSGRGYLTRLLGEAGVRYTVLHAECDPDLGGQDYANPEEPFNNLLKQKVTESGAHLGMGMDTDADRYGIIDKGGVYYRPNQILPLLVWYLGVERGFTGRVIATQTGSPLIEVLAGMIPGNQVHKPAPGALPGYVGHPFYKCRVGEIESRSLKNAFLVPVGIKYIEEIRRMDASYNSLKTLPENWRDRLLIGGEESSGLTSRGHVTDKDGPWANILVMDMLAYYGTRPENPLATIKELWQNMISMDGLWESYGTSSDPTSMAGRSDVDAPLEAKEAFIDYYLDLPLKTKETPKLAGLEIAYLGGIRYDLVEMQLRDESGNDQHYLRVRASGTEPINRIYVESSDPELGRRIMADTLRRLELLTIEQIHKAHSEWRLVDMLVQTKVTKDIQEAVLTTIKANQWQKEDITAKLKEMRLILENRNRKVANSWIDKLEN